MSLRIVFLGTGSFARAALERLVSESSDSVGIVGVVTAPDRPKGRGRKVVPSEVAVLAERHDVALHRTLDCNGADSMEWIRERRPDAVAVVDFGQLLRRALLDLPVHGCLNVHPSLLPRHRGASPVPYTILSGDEFGGVCVIRMVRKMDAGPILARVATPVGSEETAGELAERLRPMGAALLATTLRALSEGVEVVAESQDDAHATLAPKLVAEDRRVDWTRPADEISRRIRAMSPKPGVTAFLVRASGKPVRTVLLRAASIDDEGEPGVIRRFEDDAVVVGAGAGCVALSRVKPAGKGELPAGEFVRGYRPEVGDRFVAEEPSA